VLSSLLKTFAIQPAKTMVFVIITISAFAATGLLVMSVMFNRVRDVFMELHAKLKMFSTINQLQLLVVNAYVPARGVVISVINQLLAKLLQKHNVKTRAI
jgi:hypothetical protein